MPIPVPLSPHYPYTDLDDQMVVIGGVILANVLALATLDAKAVIRRDPEQLPHVRASLKLLPRLSTVLFSAAALYFLYISWADWKEKASAGLEWVLLANIIGAAAVLIKTNVVFTSPPLSEAVIGAVEP